MRSLVVYDTRFGTTAAIARHLASLLSNTDVVGLPAEGLDPNVYDLIVVGTPQPFSQPTRLIRAFLEAHRDCLSRKKSALYVTAAYELDGMFGPAPTIGGRKTAARLQAEFGFDIVAVFAITALMENFKPSGGTEAIRREIVERLPAWDGRIADYCVQLQQLVGA